MIIFIFALSGRPAVGNSHESIIPDANRICSRKTQYNIQIERKPLPTARNRVTKVKDTHEDNYELPTAIGISRRTADATVTLVIKDSTALLLCVVLLCAFSSGSFVLLRQA